MEEPLYLKMNFTGMEISPPLLLAHSILNGRSQFSSKMSLVRYFFNLSIFSGESPLDVTVPLTWASFPFKKLCEKTQLPLGAVKLSSGK